MAYILPTLSQNFNRRPVPMKLNHVGNSASARFWRSGNYREIKRNERD
jgi:hypothetical protein